MRILKLGIGLLFFVSCRQSQNIRQEQTTPADTLISAQVESKKINLLDLSYSQRKGKLLYDKYCAVCHGLEGKGDGFNAYNLDPKPKDFNDADYLESITDAWLVEVITQGGRGVKRSVLMPAYENTLTREASEDIVKYLRFLAKKEQSNSSFIEPHRDPF